MDAKLPIWFSAPEGVDEPGEWLRAEEPRLDPDDLAAVGSSKLRWVFAALIVLAGAGAFAAALTSEAGAAPLPLPSAPPPSAPATPAALAPTAIVDEDEDGDDIVDPPVELVLEPAPAGAALAAARPGPARPLFSARGRRPARIALAAPSSGADRQTAAINALAARLAAAQSWGRALVQYQRATRLSPQDPEGWFGLALCDYELGRPRAAREAARRALLASPTHSMSNLLSGFLAQEQRRFDDARAFYGRYLVNEPEGAYSSEVTSVLARLPAT